MGYNEGYLAGKADALNFVPPRASRAWKRTYRDGYSDGFHDFSKRKKQW